MRHTQAATLAQVKGDKRVLLAWRDAINNQLPHTYERFPLVVGALLRSLARQLELRGNSCAEGWGIVSRGAATTSPASPPSGAAPDTAAGGSAADAGGASGTKGASASSVMRQTVGRITAEHGSSAATRDRGTRAAFRSAFFLKIAGSRSSLFYRHPDGPPMAWVRAGRLVLATVSDAACVVG